LWRVEAAVLLAAAVSVRADPGVTRCTRSLGRILLQKLEKSIFYWAIRLCAKCRKHAALFLETEGILAIPRGIGFRLVNSRTQIVTTDVSQCAALCHRAIHTLAICVPARAEDGHWLLAKIGMVLTRLRIRAFPNDLLPTV
jgi:hypothetical protein